MKKRYPDGRGAAAKTLRSLSLSLMHHVVYAIQKGRHTVSFITASQGKGSELASQEESPWTNLLAFRLTVHMICKLESRRPPHVQSTGLF